jgi:hypothetical protein
MAPQLHSAIGFRLRVAALSAESNKPDLEAGVPVRRGEADG